MAADMLNTGTLRRPAGRRPARGHVVVMGVGPVGLMAIAGQSRGPDASWPSAAGQPGWHWPSSTGPPTWSTTKRGRHPANPPAHPQQGADCCICAGGGPDAPGAGCHHGPLGRAPWAM